MNPIVSALEEELRQAKKLIRRYQRELDALVEGTFFARKKGKRVYGYITFSEQGEIKQQYLGSLEDAKLKRYQEQMKRKRKLKELLKKAQFQCHFLDKALKHARTKST